MTDRALFESVIGPSRTGYYLSYFERAENRGYTPISWHWPAFFFGLFWLLFRKQYSWAMIYVAAHFVFALATSTVAMIGFAELQNPLFLTLVFAFQAVYIPLHANGIYYRWAKSKITQARATYPGEPEKQAAALSMEGGINRYLPLLVVMAMILLMSLGTPQALP